MSERETIEIDRLLRKSTLESHVMHSSLPTMEKSHNVSLIKLRDSFEGFSPKSSPLMTGGSPSPKFDNISTMTSPTRRSSSASHDIIVKLPLTQLVEIQPSESGWFAVFTIDEKAKNAFDNFVQAGRRHFKQTRFQAGYICPFSEPRAHEARMGAHSRLHVQISEYCGKVLNTTVCDSEKNVLYQPGDKLVDIYQKVPLGPCTVSIHMMGYWYDLTKQGPLLYLAELCTLASNEQSIVAGRPIFSLPDNIEDFGSVPITSRALELRHRAFKESRDITPPPRGSPESGSRVIKSPKQPKAMSPLRIHVAKTLEEGFSLGESMSKQIPGLLRQSSVKDVLTALSEFRLSSVRKGAEEPSPHTSKLDQDDPGVLGALLGAGGS